MTQALPKNRKALKRPLHEVVRCAGLKWSQAAIAYNTDCNLRRLKRPDAHRRQLRKATQKAFAELMAILKPSAPNG